MNDTNKKQPTTAPACLPIGNLIAWIIQEKHLKKAAIARNLGILPTSLNQYFKQPSVQVSILWRLGIAMEYNLLADVAERHPIAFETKKEAALKQELAEQKAQMERMKIELDLLKKIHKIKE